MTITKSTYLAFLAVLLTPMVANAVPIAGGVDHFHGTSSSHDQLVSTGDHGDTAHITWMSGAPPDGSIANVNWYLDNHGGTDDLSAAQQARIREAAAVWNAAGANVMLTEVFMDALADVHVHGDSVSGCSGTPIGCAETAWFTADSGPYADTDNHHMMVGNTNTALLQVLTQLTRSDWYTGAAAGGIVGTELDYMSVAIQEFGHHLGLGHNSGGGPHGDSANSPMNGALPFGVTRRVLQPTDIVAIQHLYGATSASVPEPTTLSLLGFGLAGIAWVRRRKIA